MKKIFIKILLLLLLTNAFVFHFIGNTKCNAQDFKSIHANFPIKGTPHKLNDGRILIADKNIIMFDPQNCIFAKVAQFDNNIDLSSKLQGVVLKDNRVVFISPYYNYPSERFEKEIYNLVLNELYKQKYIDSMDVSESVKSSRIRQLISDFRKLSEEQKENIYLPYVKKDKLLYEKYTNYRNAYKNSMSPQIYNPQTNNFEYLGRLKFRRIQSKKLLLDNGNILIAGGIEHRNNSVQVGEYDLNMKKNSDKFEIYNPYTGDVSILDTKLNIKSVNAILNIDKNNIFIHADDKFIIYNLSNNSSKISKDNYRGYHFFKLKDNKILYISPNIKNQQEASNIMLYDYINDRSIKLGALILARNSVELFNVILLGDDKLIISGGDNYYRYGKQALYENRIELFDLNTRKTQIIGKLPIRSSALKPVLIDDNTIMFYFGTNIYMYQIKQNDRSNYYGNRN